MTDWRNWSGSVRSADANLLQPADVEELQAMVRNAPGPLRPLGAGHSFAPLVPTAGTIIALDWMNGLIAHDPEACTATFGAGTRLADLAQRLHAHGQALVNMGDIDRQTIGGALGTATHGTGMTLGAYHTFIERVDFVDGRGGIRAFRAGHDDEMIRATGVSLGVFGIQTAVTLRNLPTYRLRKRRYALPIGDMLANFHSMMGGSRSAEFYFVPHSGHAVFIACDMTDEQPTGRPDQDDEAALATLKMLRNRTRWLPWMRRALIRNALARLPRQDFVEEWLNVYTSERRTRFNEMEYHLPLEDGPKAVAEIITLTEKQFPSVYFPIEVRTVAADDFWLSPFYQRPTCSIAIHHDAQDDPNLFFAAAERIFRRYGGRPHWGKIHSLTAEDLSRLYPRWKDALEVRRMTDPDNRFVTPYIAKLLGIE